MKRAYEITLPFCLLLFLAYCAVRKPVTMNVQPLAETAHITTPTTGTPQPPPGIIVGSVFVAAYGLCIIPQPPACNTNNTNTPCATANGFLINSGQAVQFGININGICTVVGPNGPIPII